MLISVVAFISAFLGFAFKSVWQAFVDIKKGASQANREKNIENIEAQLAEFYWPIYLRLQKDNVVWEKMLDRESDDEEKRKAAYEIDRSILLPNHKEIVEIIEKKIHRAHPDQELEKQLLDYLRHTAVYFSLRSAGVTDKDPIAFGEPWPTELFSLIEKKTHELQEKYDLLIDRKI